MNKSFPSGIVAILFLLLLASTAYAVPITDCQNITVSGTYTLAGDTTGNDFWEDTNVFAGTSTQCIRITVDDVEIDGNGFTLQTSASDAIEIVGGFQNISIHDITIFNDAGGNGPILSDSADLIISNAVLNGSTAGIALAQVGGMVSLLNVYAQSAGSGLSVSTDVTLIAINLTLFSPVAVENQGDINDNVDIDASYIEGVWQYDGSQGASLTITNTTLNGSFSSSNDITNGALLHNTYVNPSNTGFSQTCINSGGICSTPYDLSTEAAGSTLTDNMAVALTSANTAPTLNAVTLTATTNNQTLIASANASDTENDTMTYFWRLFRNNTLISSGSNGTFPQGFLRNFNNFSANSVDGTYIVEVFANDGSLNSSRTNSTPLTLTFPGVLNTAPTMQSVLVSVTSDNQTFILNLNATDPQNDTVEFYFVTYRNNIAITSGHNVGFYPQGITVNAFNRSASSTNGTYIFQITPGDGTLLGNPLNSSPITVTFASAPPTPPTGNSDVDHAIVVLITLSIIALLYVLFLQKIVDDKEIDNAFFIVIGIIFVVAMIVII